MTVSTQCSLNLRVMVLLLAIFRIILERALSYYPAVFPARPGRGAGAHVTRGKKGPELSPVSVPPHSAGWFNRFSEFYFKTGNISNSPNKIAFLHISEKKISVKLLIYEYRIHNIFKTIQQNCFKYDFVKLPGWLVFFNFKVSVKENTTLCNGINYSCTKVNLLIATKIISWSKML